MPSDTKLTHALEDAVEDLFEEDPENVRPKAVRTRAEEKLGLQSGYFACEDDWKDRSKQILQEKYEQLMKIAENAEINRKKRKSSEREDTSNSPPPSKKRNVTAPQKQKQKQNQRIGSSKAKSKPKVTKAKEILPIPDSSDADEVNDRVTMPKSETDELAQEEHEPVSAPADVEPVDDAQNDSDLSSLVDDAPPKVSRKKKAPSAEVGSNPKSKTGPKPKKVSDSALSPQEAELKELQSQLLQCGVRKVWQFHLKSFETHKQKVAELKRLLREVGMEGRFSKEKARQIKETRELQADIEAIQEGEEKWGKKEDQKRLLTGRAQARIVDFDDEESD